MRWHLYKSFVRFNRDGLNTTESRDKRIIVSLTSYPERIKTVPYVIASLLKQTMKPDKIILWLGSAKFPDKKLPKIFEKIKRCGVDIEFRKDVGPHTKYFYAFKEYPEDLVITFDDDVIYDHDIVETLYAAYLEYPGYVYAMRVDKINFTDDGNLTGYLKFDIGYRTPKGHTSHAYLATGVGGVLYPPHCVHDEIFNLDAMIRLCPKADDIWLKIMELMNDMRVIHVCEEGKVQGWDTLGSQGTALGHSNMTGGENDVQMKAVLNAYKTCPKNGKTLLEMMREG